MSARSAPENARVSYGTLSAHGSALCGNADGRSLEQFHVSGLCLGDLGKREISRRRGMELCKLFIEARLVRVFAQPGGYGGHSGPHPWPIGPDTGAVASAAIVSSILADLTALIRKIRDGSVPPYRRAR
jgi:hypothetical protein